jgi:hypothetical protein
MKTGDSIRALADAVSTLETAGYDVTTVAPIDESLVVDGAVETNLRVELSSPSTLDGTDGVEVVPREATLTDDGDVSLSLDLQISKGTNPVVDEATAEKERADVSRGSVGNDTPAYKDPKRLRAAYEASDTFAEMTRVLDVDVTPQTVRKYAVRHDIHEVDSTENEREADTAAPEDEDPTAETSEDGPTDAASGSSQPDVSADPTDASPDGAREVARSDGVGLPAETTLDAVVDAVRDGKTLFDVQRQIGADRDETKALLERLDLLELVHGRATETAGETSVEEIRARVDAATGER